MTFVVDASVAHKGFVAESGSNAAETLMAAGQTFLTPHLIVADACNVAWLRCSEGEITAEQRGASLVTADGRLLARLTTTPWARLVVKLGDHATQD